MTAVRQLPGQRALAKAERRRRLKEAAIAVFREKGFQGATTREIASRAKLGAATLFRYAEQKRDLLLMIVNDDLNDIDAVAFAQVAGEAPLVDALLVLFTPRFHYWNANLALAREAIPETVLARASDETFEARRYRNRRRHLLEAIVDLIRRRQTSGSVRANEDSELIAELLLGIYLAQLRHWLAEPKPDVARGIARLQRLLTLAIGGVAVPVQHAATRAAARSVGR
jgi:AcrR family transcriptional regulator